LLALSPDRLLVSPFLSSKGIFIYSLKKKQIERFIQPICEGFLREPYSMHLINKEMIVMRNSQDVVIMDLKTWGQWKVLGGSM